MRADAPGEGRGDAAMFEVELGVADLRLGVLDRGLRGALVGRALVDGLRRSERLCGEVLGAIELRGRRAQAARVAVSSCAFAWASLIS